MSKTYEDSRFGVRKILTFPSVTLSSAPLSAGAMYFEDNITITEIGIMITTKVSGTSSPTITLYNGSSLVGTITVPTDTMSGVCVRSTTAFTANGMSTTETLILRTAVTATSAGAGVPYIKYTERFV